MTAVERMTHDDSVFLRIEDGIHHMHLASVAVLKGPAPDFQELRSLVARLLPRVPRYRQRVRFVPFDLQRPVWVDDAHFNIDYHLRHTALPEPGSDEQLRNLVGRVMSQQLDRTKPLWELWVVEGLEEGRWVLMAKVHHTLVDAVFGTDLLSLMLERRSDVDVTEPTPWNPRPEPSDIALVAGAARDLATNPVESYRVAQSLAHRVRRVTGDVVDAARHFNALARPERGAGSLTGPLGPHRRWHELDLPLDDALAVSAGLDTSVNDVVLAAVAHGFRTLLLHRGEPVERRFIRAFVPVSLHSTATRDRFDNTVSATFTDLPVGVDDAAGALDLINRQHESLVDSRRTVAGEILTPLSGFAPPLLLSLGMRAATRAVGEFEDVHTITTNVPGPSHELQVLGRPMLEAYPYVPLRADMRLAVAVYTYHGHLGFGITGDYDTAPDLDVFCAGITAGFEQLLTAGDPAAPMSASTGA
jgi:WS/DGAT/MGAT family acyltransferase